MAVCSPQASQFGICKNETWPTEAKCTVGSEVVSRAFDSGRNQGGNPTLPSAVLPLFPLRSFRLSIHRYMNTVQNNHLPQHEGFSLKQTSLATLVSEEAAAGTWLSNVMANDWPFTGQGLWYGGCSYKAGEEKMAFLILEHSCQYMWTRRSGTCLGSYHSGELPILDQSLTHTESEASLNCTETLCRKNQIFKKVDCFLL